MTISVKQNNTFSTVTGVWVKVSGVWEQVATNGLDGLGTWATLSRATGSPKRYEYPDGGSTWVAYEWTANGSVTTTAGMVDALLVGGGGHASSNAAGAGGYVNKGLLQFPGGGAVPITVGSAVSGGRPTSLGNLDTVNGGGYSLWNGSAGTPDRHTGTTYDILGTEKMYGAGGENAARVNAGGGGATNSNSPGQPGVFCARVPKEFDNIPSSDWVTRTVYFAEVSDGVVVAVHAEHHYGDGSVSALPQAELVECDASVQAGWDYVDGVFSAPTATQMPADPDDI